MANVVSWSAGPAEFAVLVHGGAGRRSEAAARDQAEGCERAACAAERLLDAGHSALDAVQRAVEILEDDPRFNAGTGGALTARGELELDASIMDGRDRRAGAVCCLPPYGNPIAVARAVLDDGRHVLLCGQGADEFAKSRGFAPAPPSAMITDDARDRLRRLLQRGGAAALDIGAVPEATDDERGNTVGAVARDRAGHVAAATSTGGILGSLPGRVGDSPLIGAGTYADDRTCAASATGLGEGIIRVGLCAIAATLVRHGASPIDAVRRAIDDLQDLPGGSGGLIIATATGELAWARCTQSMAWAVRRGPAT